MGTGETLADIALQILYNALDENKITPPQIEDYLIKHKMILSSMRKWSPKKNQAIIVDTFIDIADESSLKKDIWNIINGTLALIVNKSSIFIRDNKTYFDFNIAIDYVGCERITVWEMCLINKYLSEHIEKFNIHYIHLNPASGARPEYSMIFFIKKPI